MATPIHILHLEDGQADALVVRVTLEAAGIDCTITRVQDREGFVAALERGGVHLVLADVLEVDARADHLRLEARFIDAQKREIVGQFTAGVAHDFNNILGVIVGYTDLLASGLDPASPLRQLTEEIQLASARAAGLARQLLGFSQTTPVTPAVLDLNAGLTDLDSLTPAVQATPPPRGTETVLIVEDEPVLLLLARRILEGQGYHVLSAANGQDGLRVAQAHTGAPIGLVLTDVVMPVMGGRVMAEWLKVALPDLKILFTSGYTDDAVAQPGGPEPGSAFLPKPYTAGTLALKVRETLDAPV